MLRFRDDTDAIEPDQERAHLLQSTRLLRKKPIAEHSHGNGMVLDESVPFKLRERPGCNGGDEVSTLQSLAVLVRRGGN